MQALEDRRRMGAILVATLVAALLGPLSEPAFAATCGDIAHNHQTWYAEYGGYSSTYQQKPPGSGCNDLNGH